MEKYTVAKEFIDRNYSYINAEERESLVFMILNFQKEQESKLLLNSEAMVCNVKNKCIHGDYCDNANKKSCCDFETN